jgi:signal transduction histidine kinase
MNSVTPISSLTETMQSMLMDKEGKQKSINTIGEDIIGDIRFSLETIQKRSEGLLKFVETYRKLTRVPKPTPEPVDLKALFSSVEKLMQEPLAQKGIEMEVVIYSLATHAPLDRNLIEQVLINLITNSVHALEGRPEPKVSLMAYRNDRSLIIEVRDNGKGIGEKELNEIFVPFFSTRKDGSGIGLSLSKQIVSLHGGTIKVASKVGVGTSFYLSFSGR